MKNRDGAGRTERIEVLHFELHCRCTVKDHALGPCDNEPGSQKRIPDNL
jgi:hypothetical protein